MAKRAPPWRRPPNESRIEARADGHAKALGWTSRKMNGLGFRSWPDRLFIPPKQKLIARRPFWVEFKKHDGVLTKDQARLIAELRARGERVRVCHSFEEFIVAFDAEHRWC